MGRMESCCFTGHRPQKLAFGFDEQAAECKRIKLCMLRAAERLINERGVDTFYSGMALGTDMWGASAVLYLRDERGYANIKLVAVKPYPAQSERWSESYRRRYDELLERADSIVTIEQHYTDSCMRRRNEYMVDMSAHMIAVYNGTPGGTRSTVEYARKSGLHIITIEEIRED